MLIDSRTVRCIRVAGLAAASPQRPAVVRGPAPADPAAALSVRAVSAGYGRAPVLSGVDLDVPPESCVAVVGESGSGKTTLARCIVGLHGNWTGEITFDGATLARGARDRPKDVLRRVQYIFQNPYTSLNPRKTVGQIVAQPLEQFLGLPFRERSRARRGGAGRRVGSAATSRLATRISCLAGNGSGSPSPAPWWSSPTC